MMRIGLRSDAFNFGDGDHRQKSNEQQEAGEKEAERADVGANIDFAWTKIAPTGGQKIAVQRNDNDDKSLKPHADVHNDRNDEHKPQRLPALFEPKHLGHDDVRNHNQKPRPLIRAERAIHEMELLHWTAAVPGDEEFHRVGVTDN